MLDLPEGITTCLFDLDGVLTQTAKVHAKAWKQMFDEYLRERAGRTDTFLAGAKAVGAEPAQCAVFEDAEAGVAAGRAGHFGQVVGVDRTGHADALREHGADVVVEDLAELLEKSL